MSNIPSIWKFYITDRRIQAHAKRATKGRQESEETCKEGLQVVALFILIISYHLYESYDMSHILCLRFHGWPCYKSYPPLAVNTNWSWLVILLFRTLQLLKSIFARNHNSASKKHVPEYVLTFILIPSGFFCIDTLCLQFDSKLLSCNKFFSLYPQRLFCIYKVKSIPNN